MATQNPSLPRTITVQTDDGPVDVSKLTLGRAAELAQILDSLPELLRGVQEDEGLANALTAALEGGTENEDAVALGQAVLRVAPKLFLVAQDAMIRLICVGAGLDRERVERLGLDEAMEILGAILEVNNVAALVASAKNLGRLLGLNREAIRAAQTATRAAYRASGSKT